MKKMLLSLFSAIVLAIAVVGSGGPAGKKAEQPDSRVNDSSAQILACGRCGDGACVKSCGETSKTCPQDCGGGSTY